MQLADTVLVMCILMSAYFIRGITGFGSALISVPLLALSQPLQFAIPLVLALDFTASVVLGSTNTKKANWSEIKILLPDRAFKLRFAPGVDELASQAVRRQRHFQQLTII